MSKKDTVKKAAQKFRTNSGKYTVDQPMVFLKESKLAKSGGKSLFEQLFESANAEEFTKNLKTTAKEFDKELYTKKNHELFSVEYYTQKPKKELSQEFQAATNKFVEMKEIEKDINNLNNFYKTVESSCHHLMGARLTYSNGPSNYLKDEISRVGEDKAISGYLFGSSSKDVTGKLNSFVRMYEKHFIENTSNAENKKQRMEELKNFKKSMVEYYKNRNNIRKFAEDIKNDISTLKSFSIVKKLQNKLEGKKAEKCVEGIEAFCDGLQKANNIKTSVNKRIARWFRKVHSEFKESHKINKKNFKEKGFFGMIGENIKSNLKSDKAMTKASNESLNDLNYSANFQLVAEGLEQNDKTKTKMGLKNIQTQLKEELSGIKSKGEVDQKLSGFKQKLESLKLKVSEGTKTKAVDKVMKRVNKVNQR